MIERRPLPNSAGSKSDERSSRPGRLLRSPRIEPLEPRVLLDGNTPPTLAEIPGLVDNTLEILAGAPLNVPLDGFDADGDPLSYEVQSNNPIVTAVVPVGNRSLRISVEGYGDMVVELFEDLAPRTTARIIQLAQQGFYNGLTFHRVADDMHPNQPGDTPSRFVIQGGDPTGTGGGGSGVEFDDEFNAALQHTSAGVMSMAKTVDDTNDSQFFITSAPARHLDFNHTVFGFITEGDAVRNAIQNAPVDTEANGFRPNPPLVMSNVSVFMDQENGVLRLSAPAGTTSGEADVTITVSDGKGGTTSRTFHVRVKADPTDNYPFLQPVEPIRTTVNTPVSFDIPATDVDGGAMYFSAEAYGQDNQYLDVAVDSATGRVTVTPKTGVIGVTGIYLDVRAQSPADYFQGRDVWDTQAVPVYISPAGPASVTLLASSDTGPSSGDGVTNLNNTAGKTLRFQVEGVAEGADVVLYADGHEIGRQTASGASVIVETNGTFTLTEGRHDIWAVQILRNEPVDIGNEHSHVDLSSTASSPTTIIVDTAAPLITSYAVTDAAEGRAYLYDVDSTEEADGGVTYRLTQSPAGMSIDDMAAGRIVWTPAQGQAGTWPVTVRVTDKAGNYNEQQFQATVTPAPTVVGIPAGNVLVDEGQALTLPLGATGSDARRPFVFSLGSDAPQGAAINAQTGEFSWQPSEAQGPGLYQITVRVTDNLGAVGTGTLRVRVAELNQPPVIGAIEDRTVDEGELIQFNVPVTDADLPANALRFSLADGAPAGASIDPLTGRFTWAPSELQGGQSFSITVRVTDRADPTDSTALQDEATFNVTVREVDSPPVFSPLETLVVMPGDQVRVQFQAADPDIPANGVTYSLLGDVPAGMTLDAATGGLSWQVPQSGVAGGGLTITVQATETGPAQRSSTQQVRLIVLDLGAIVTEPAATETAATETARTAAPGPVAPDLLALLALDGPRAAGGAAALGQGSAAQAAAGQAAPTIIRFNQFNFLGARNGSQAQPGPEDQQNQGQPAEGNPSPAKGAEEKPAENSGQQDAQGQQSRASIQPSQAAPPQANDAAIEALVGQDPPAVPAPRHDPHPPMAAAVAPPAAVAPAAAPLTAPQPPAENTSAAAHARAAKS